MNCREAGSNALPEHCLWLPRYPFGPENRPSTARLPSSHRSGATGDAAARWRLSGVLTSGRVDLLPVAAVNQLPPVDVLGSPSHRWVQLCTAHDFPPVTGAKVPDRRRGAVLSDLRVVVPFRTGSGTIEIFIGMVMPPDDNSRPKSSMKMILMSAAFGV